MDGDMDSTGYAQGDCANQYGVPVPTDETCARHGVPRDPSAAVGTVIPCPEDCYPPDPSETRDPDSCPVCRGCGLVSLGRVRRAYDADRAAEILAPLMLVADD